MSQERSKELGKLKWRVLSHIIESSVLPPAEALNGSASPHTILSNHGIKTLKEAEGSKDSMTRGNSGWERINSRRLIFMERHGIPRTKNSLSFSPIIPSTGCRKPNTKNFPLFLNATQWFICMVISTG